MKNSIPVLKQVLLTGVFAGMAALLLLVPAYRNWHTNTVQDGYHFMKQTWRKQDIRNRRILRYGSVLDVYARLKKKLVQQGGHSGSRILIPSNEYLRQQHISYVLDEPASIYYKSGLMTVLPYTDLSYAANYALVLNNGKDSLIALNERPVKDSLIRLYRTYPKSDY